MNQELIHIKDAPFPIAYFDAKDFPTIPESIEESIKLIIQTLLQISDNSCVNEVFLKNKQYYPLFLRRVFVWQYLELNSEVQMIALWQKQFLTNLPTLNGRLIMQYIYYLCRKQLNLFFFLLIHYITIILVLTCKYGWIQKVNFYEFLTHQTKESRFKAFLVEISFEHNDCKQKFYGSEIYPLGDLNIHFILNAIYSIEYAPKPTEEEIAQYFESEKKIVEKSRNILSIEENQLKESSSIFLPPSNDIEMSLQHDKKKKDISTSEIIRPIDFNLTEIDHEYTSQFYPRSYLVYQQPNQILFDQFDEICYYKIQTQLRIYQLYLINPTIAKQKVDSVWIDIYSQQNLTNYHMILEQLSLQKFKRLNDEYLSDLGIITSDLILQQKQQQELMSHSELSPIVSFFQFLGNKVTNNIDYFKRLCDNETYYETLSQQNAPLEGMKRKKLLLSSIQEWIVDCASIFKLYF